MALTGELLLSLAVKSTLVLAGAAVLVKALGRTSAAVRHLAWSAALAGLLLLPLASGVLPAWQPPLPAGLQIVPSQAPTVLDVVARRPDFSLSAVGLAWCIWLIGAAMVLAHTAVGMRKIAGIVRRARPLGGFGAGVLVSAEVPIPAVCGLWRPRVVLPEDALSWPVTRMRMVLSHERMHISRHDTRMHLAAQVASALYWPNPLVWWAAGCLRRMEVRGERPAPATPASPPPPPPVSDAPGQQRIRVGGTIQQAKLDHIARPSYPPDCKAEGVEGTVVLRAVIGTDGSVLNLQQVNELVDKRLVEAATEAVKQWRYQPTILNGQPVEVITEIQVNFVLAN